MNIRYKIRDSPDAYFAECVIFRSYERKSNERLLLRKQALVLAVSPFLLVAILVD